MATYEITAEMNLKKIIDESREVAQALNEFANNLERIEKKYAEPQENEGSVDTKDCTTCIGFRNKDYEQSFCYDCIKGIQNHYKAESEG